jgi:hypothetical protein
LLEEDDDDDLLVTQKCGLGEGSQVHSWITCVSMNIIQVKIGKKLQKVKSYKANFELKKNI